MRAHPCDEAALQRVGRGLVLATRVLNPPGVVAAFGRHRLAQLLALCGILYPQVVEGALHLLPVVR